MTTIDTWTKCGNLEGVPANCRFFWVSPVHCLAISYHKTASSHIGLFLSMALTTSFIYTCKYIYRHVVLWFCIMLTKLIGGSALFCKPALVHLHNKESESMCFFDRLFITAGGPVWHQWDFDVRAVRECDTSERGTGSGKENLFVEAFTGCKWKGHASTCG